MDERNGTESGRRWWAFALLTFLLCAVGARVGIPGVNGPALGAHVAGLLSVYDRAVGGAISRGAVLALGVMPYLSARVFMWLARRTSRRWTRALTLLLALVQSYGFARFAESIPGAVTHPGAAFVARTMALLTAGALLVMWLVERAQSAERGARGD